MHPRERPPSANSKPERRPGWPIAKENKSKEKKNKDNAKKDKVVFQQLERSTIPQEAHYNSKFSTARHKMSSTYSSSLDEKFSTSTTNCSRRPRSVARALCSFV